MQKRMVLAILIIMISLLYGCGSVRRVETPVTTIDPYAGLVQVESGYGTQIWVREYEDVPVNPLRHLNVFEANEITDENGVNYSIQTGIDVSEHQGVIDWDRIDSNITNFAIIRAGYRGYGEAGKLCMDAYFHDNLDGALRNNIPVGLYFFSQAVSPDEAEEEAEFILFLLTGYDPTQISLPIYYDWENIGFDDARTDGLDGETLTDCAIAFCNRLKKAGYEAGIYSYRSLSYFRYDLPQIDKYPVWIGALGNCPDYYYRFDIWQYSTDGAISGVEGNVDLDMIFTPVIELERKDMEK